MSKAIQIPDLDIDLDFYFKNMPPQSVLDGLEISDSKLEDLLDLLRQGSKAIEEEFKNFVSENIDRYHGLGKQFAPIAYAIYDRLLQAGKEPRISTFLAINRYQSSGCSPNSIIFWADPDAVRGLYESLEKDGYYGTT